MSQHTPFRLPDTMTRADIGPYIRGLREHFGLTQQDVSERTHIRARYIHAIEAGAMEQMPGKAYAKGYVHTYAEFLGLDPEQVVGIFFGPEPVREVQQHFVPEPMKRGNKSLPGQWRPLVAAGVVVALVVLAITQLSHRGADEEVVTVAPVAEVPEEMLAEMRTMVMPERGNEDCLGEATALGCLYLTPEWQAIRDAQMSTPYTYADKRFAPESFDEETDETSDDE